MPGIYEYNPIDTLITSTRVYANNVFPFNADAYVDRLRWTNSSGTRENLHQYVSSPSTDIYIIGQNDEFTITNISSNKQRDGITFSLGKFSNNYQHENSKINLNLRHWSNVDNIPVRLDAKITDQYFNQFYYSGILNAESGVFTDVELGFYEKNNASIPSLIKGENYLTLSLSNGTGGFSPERFDIAYVACAVSGEYDNYNTFPLFTQGQYAILVEENLSSVEFLGHSGNLTRVVSSNNSGAVFDYVEGFNPVQLSGVSFYLGAFSGYELSYDFFKRKAVSAKFQIEQPSILNVPSLNYLNGQQISNDGISVNFDISMTVPGSSYSGNLLMCVVGDFSDDSYWFSKIHKVPITANAPLSQFSGYFSVGGDIPSSTNWKESPTITICLGYDDYSTLSSSMNPNEISINNLNVDVKGYTTDEQLISKEMSLYTQTDYKFEQRLRPIHDWFNQLDQRWFNSDNPLPSGWHPEPEPPPYVAPCAMCDSGVWGGTLNISGTWQSRTPWPLWTSSDTSCSWSGSFDSTSDIPNPVPNGLYVLTINKQSEGYYYYYEEEVIGFEYEHTWGISVDDSGSSLKDSVIVSGDCNTIPNNYYVSGWMWNGSSAYLPANFYMEWS